MFWHVGRGTELDLAHLEVRMRQSGRYRDPAPLAEQTLRRMLRDRISGLDLTAARSDVERFLPDTSAVEVWSREFFFSVADRIAIR